MPNDNHSRAPSKAYDEGHFRAFGERAKFCLGCGMVPHWCDCPTRPRRFMANWGGAPCFRCEGRDDGRTAREGDDASPAPATHDTGEPTP
jgi:hypothetical protein